MKKYILKKPHKFFGDTKAKGTMLMLSNDTAKVLLKKGVIEEFGGAKEKKVSPPNPKK